jgi:hypothetical protein
MAGYLGSKAVLLSTTAASVTGNATIGGDLTVGSNALFVDESTGDISFYEDTGTTPKFFWDASAESLGIGTSSPSAPLQVTQTPSDTVGDVGISLKDANNAIEFGLRLDNASKDLHLDGYYSGAWYNRMTIDRSSGNVGIGTTTPAAPIDALVNSAAYVGRFVQSNTANGDGVLVQIGSTASSDYALTVRSDGGNTPVLSAKADGNVGIGTFSPSYPLHVSGTGDKVMAVTAGASSIAALNLGNSTNLADGGIRYDNSADALILRASNAEKMRITSSGNVGIGTSSPEGQLHLYSSSVGAPAADADDFVIEKTGDTGLSILSTTTGRIYFGDAASNDQGSIRYVHTDNSMRFETDSSERMRIDSSGRVGIGNGSPQRELHIGAADNTNHEGIIVLNNGGATGYRAGIEWRYESNTTPRARISINASSQSLEFDTAGTLRMRLGSNGRLGIGTTAPDAKLMVETAANVEQPFAINDSSNTAGQTHRIAFRTGGTEVGTIKSTNSGTSFNTTSDYRLKENVTDVTDGITRVKQLAPKRFNFIVNPDVTVDGFIAHEAQSVVPEAVTGTQDAMRDEEYEITPAVLDDDGNEVTPAVMGTRSVPDYQGIDQSKLVPLLTAALQEAIAKIETLETEMTSVKARLDALEAE